MHIQHSLLALVLGSVCSLAAAVDSSLSVSLHGHVAPIGFSVTPLGWHSGAVPVPMNLVQAGSGEYYLRELAPRKLRMILPAGVGAHMYMYSHAPGTGLRLQHVNDSSQILALNIVGDFGGGVSGMLGGAAYTQASEALELFLPGETTEEITVDMSLHFQTENIDPTQMPGHYVGQVTMVFDQLI